MQVPSLLVWMPALCTTPSPRWASDGSLMIYWRFLLPWRTSLKIPQPCSLTTESWQVSLPRKKKELAACCVGGAEISQIFRITVVSLLFFFAFCFSRRCLPWLQLQASTCFQGKWCCPGEQKSPSASSQRWPTHRSVVSQARSIQMQSSAPPPTPTPSCSLLCLCPPGRPWHQHPVTICPHPAGSNSPVRLCGSSLTGHLGSGRAPQSAKIKLVLPLINGLHKPTTAMHLSHAQWHHNWRLLAEKEMVGGWSCKNSSRLLKKYIRECF